MFSTSSLEFERSACFFYIVIIVESVKSVESIIPLFLNPFLIVYCVLFLEYS